MMSDVFSHFLPWTKSRIKKIDKEQWRILLSPDEAIEQDQSIPITHLMCLLYRKLNPNIRFFDKVKRRGLVEWYKTDCHSIFNLEQLFLILKSDQKLVAKSPKKVGFNLVGYDRGRLGLGEDLRSYALYLERRNIPFSIYHIGHPSDDVSIDHSKYHSFELPYKNSLFFMNPIELEKLLDVFEGDLSGFGYTIAIPPWELQRVPNHWLKPLEMFNEVWAISSFVKAAFECLPRLAKKVKLANPIIPAKLKHPVSDVKRQSKPFTFLYVFDAASYLKRKNPEILIESFLRAFERTNRNVRLILKVSNLRFDENSQLLRKTASVDSRIKLIEDSYDEVEMMKLWAACDCYVSLHRSEGFGRTIAEAIAHNVPVIATNWSGSVDILGEDNFLGVDFKLIPIKEGEYPFCKEQVWAEPLKEDAKNKIKWVYDNRNSPILHSIVTSNRDRFDKYFDINVCRKLLEDLL